MRKASFIGLIMLLAAPAQALIPEDNGTCPDGAFIFPEAMSLKCGLSCSDGENEDKIEECLQSLALEDEDGAIQSELLEQLYRTELNMVLKMRSAAGNYEETLDKILEEKSGTQIGSPAAGGDSVSEGSDLRVKQTKNIKVNARSTSNMVDLISLTMFDVQKEFFETFYSYDALVRRSEKVEEDSKNERLNKTVGAED